MFEKIKDFWKGVWRKLFPIASIESALGVKVTQDTEMTSAIALWSNLYENKPPWLSDTVQTMGLPAAIANEIARLVTLELESTVTGDNDRAKYLDEQYQKVIRSIRTYTEYACAKGGLVFKPYRDGANLAVEYVQADNFYPVNYGSDGTITAAVFIEQKTVGKDYYTRLEYHDFDGTKELIRNRAFKSTIKDSLGREVSLQEVDEWKDLQIEGYMENIERPLFAYFKVPIANNVDTYSPLGASVFSRAIDVIKDADKRYSQENWEFDSAERAVDIDCTAIKKDAQGKEVIPEGKERLFRKLDAEGGKDGKTFYETYSPDIRDEAHERSLNSKLRKIEFLCGLAYGTLSNVEESAKTATEVLQSKQRSYSTVSDIQKALQDALEHLVYILDVYTTYFRLAPKGKYEMAFDWDDSLVVDAETERLKDKEDVRDGIMSKLEFRMKWYGEDEETAAKKLANIKAEEPEDDDLMGF